MTKEKIYKIIKIITSLIIIIADIIAIASYSPSIYALTYYTFSVTLFISIFSMINVFVRRLDKYYFYMVPLACIMIPVVGLIFSSNSGFFEVFVHFIYPLLIIADYYVLSVRYGNRKHRSYSHQEMFIVLIFPFVYIIYTLIIGYILDMYPYTFINYSDLSVLSLILFSVIFILAFIALVFLSLVVNNHQFTRIDNSFINFRVVSKVPNYITSVALLLVSITALVTFAFTAGLIPDRDDHYVDSYPHYFGSTEEGYIFTNVNSNNCIVLSKDGSITDYDYDCSGENYSGNYIISFVNNTEFSIKDVLNKVEHQVKLEELVDIDNFGLLVSYYISNDELYIKYSHSFSSTHFVHIKLDIITSELVYNIESRLSSEPIKYESYYKIEDMFYSLVEYFDLYTFESISSDSIIIDVKDVDILSDDLAYSDYYIGNDFYIGYNYEYIDGKEVYNFVNYNYADNYVYNTFERNSYLYFSDIYFSSRIYLNDILRKAPHFYRDSLYLFEYFKTEIYLTVYDEEFNVSYRTYDFHNNFSYVVAEDTIIFISLYRNLYSLHYNEYTTFSIVNINTNDIITSENIIYYST